MRKDSIQKVDFSNSISPKIINENFNIIQQSIFQERLETFGSGICKGLNVIQEGFKLTLTEGSVINSLGEKIHIPSKQIILNLPYLKEITQEIIIDSQYAKFKLPYCAYDGLREHTATIKSSSIDICLKNNTDIHIKPVSVEIDALFNETTVTINENYRGQTLLVTYQVAQTRYDTIYIDKNYEIQVAESIGSNSSASIYEDIEGCEQKLYVYKIDPYKRAYEESHYAEPVKVSKYCYLRNIYTDENGDLYIKGCNFNDLQIIHFTKPDPIYINALYYDEQTNRLKIYREINGIKDWYNVNDDSVTNVIEKKIWDEKDNPDDYQTFIFEAEELNMRFIPGKNELDVMIEQYPLHSNQFEEITISNALSLGLQDVLEEKGYDLANLPSIEECENTGIGFRLVEKLAYVTYVEARVCHRIKETGSHERFQRSATFIKEDNVLISCNDLSDNVLYLTCYYRYGEHQLEVYKEGKRLTLGIDYKEGAVDEKLAVGNLSNKITILMPWSAQELVSYKITHNVYSYDHVMALLKPVENTFQEYVTTVNTKIAEMKSTIDNLLSMENNYKQALNQMSQMQQTMENALKNCKPNIFEYFPVALNYPTPLPLEFKVKITAYKFALNDMLLLFDQNRRLLIENTDYSVIIEEDSYPSLILKNNGSLPTCIHVYVLKLNAQD